MQLQKQCMEGVELYATQAVFEECNPTNELSALRDTSVPRHMNVIQAPNCIAELFC